MHQARPQIAVPAPRNGAADTAIDLDGFFGFHPSLSPLKSIYDEGHLAVVHAVGSPDNTRSHFDAQDYMEAGSPGQQRALPTAGSIDTCRARRRTDANAFRAIALDAKMPRSLMGPAPALALARIQDFDVRGHNPRQGGGSELYSAFEAMWHNSTFDAVKMLKNANPQRFQPENGARYPGGQFGQGLLQMSQLIKADIGLEVGFLDIGGWDTHANQAGAAESAPARIWQKGCAAFYRDLGDRMRNVVVLTMTEFGRSIKQNGSGGTDHGHASALFVMGGPVKGRKVYGKWPGLATEQLYEGRDLALTTDFRDVFAEILKKHMRAADTARVFPGWQPGQALGIL